MTRHATPGINRSASLPASRSTLATTVAKPVGPVGTTPGSVPLGKAPAANLVVVVPADEADRLLLAAYRALPLLPVEVRNQVAGLLTKQAMAVIIGAGVLWAGSQFFGVGEIFDVVAGGFTVATIGWDGIKALKGFATFYQLASNAKTNDEIDAAAQSFATAVLAAASAIGWAALGKWLGGRSSRLAMAETDGVKMARWEKFIASIEFDVPRDTGMLWSKMRPLEELWKVSLEEKGITASEMVAEQEKLTCLEGVLRKNGFFELYARDFGSEQNLITQKIWEELSVRYVQSLEGKVTGWVTRGQHFQHMDETAAQKLMQELNINADNKTAVMIAKALYPERLHELKKLPFDSTFTPRPDPIITREIEELIKMMEENSKITAIEILDVSTRESFGYWTREIVEALKRLESRGP